MLHANSVSFKYQNSLHDAWHYSKFKDQFGSFIVEMDCV